MEKPPVSTALEKLGMPHRVFRHENQVISFEQAASERGQRPSQVVRSILFRIAQDEFIMALVAGTDQISWKALRKHLGRSRVSMATEDEVFAVTGYRVGTVAPFGLPRQLKVLIDAGVMKEDEVSIGSGMRNTAVILKSADLHHALKDADVVSLTVTTNMENSMSNTYKERALKFLEIEWATYIERFNRWPAEEGLKRVNAQGYGRFRDMLAHILAWWEEGMGIILAIAEDREYARRKYDFDAFNAEAVAKYKDWDEAEFLAHFEKTRQNAVGSLKSMDEAAWENRRVRAWINGIFIHHAREHLVASSRFLILDTLQNEWSRYVEDFGKIEDKKAFLKKQGLENFREMLGHVTGWWEQGERIISGILQDPNFKWQDRDTDAFNAELIVKYRKLSDAEVQKQFENKRQDMIRLVKDLPEEAFTNKDIEGWLAADVVEHFDEHAAHA